VWLRAFAGLTLGEAAEVMGIGRRTADRCWAYARAWLCDALAENSHTGNATSSGGPPSSVSSLRFRLPNFRGSNNIEFDA
jgi:hypothetical protein